MQALFFCMIPLGILILIFSIRILQKCFSGDIILEIPYSRKSAELIIPESGHYSIWHKGQFFKKAPLGEFRPEITNKSTGEKIKLSSLLLRPNTNNGKTARMELFRFSAPAGKYIIELAEGSSIGVVENTLLRLLPVKMVDYDKYFIQIRETKPVFQILIGIMLASIAGLCIIGGLVFGILADQIFTE
jgi:hypothetical protein